MESCFLKAYYLMASKNFLETQAKLISSKIIGTSQDMDQNLSTENK